MEKTKAKLIVGKVENEQDLERAFSLNRNMFHLAALFANQIGRPSERDLMVNGLGTSDYLNSQKIFC